VRDHGFIKPQKRSKFLGSGPSAAMKRSIPPRTMKDVSRSQRKREGRGGAIQQLTVSGLTGLGAGGRRRQNPEGKPGAATTFPTGLFQRPRNWRFQTKPLFKKIEGPLVDVFHEAEEVLIVIDLGGISRGDVALTMSADRYCISAKMGDEEFKEEIPLPPEVDIERCVEHFRNGILEIVLPRKKRRCSK
jgi:HSP20 family molecular chaperone IbpA